MPLNTNAIISNRLSMYFLPVSISWPAMFKNDKIVLTMKSDLFPPLIAIVGPTGIGKTTLAVKLSLALAEDGNLACEIVSADSRQIYRMMDIGTAKPTSQELAAVPHHLVDIVPPDYIVTLAEFQERAYRAIDDIHARGRLPLLVGGTGQWVKAVVEGWGIPRVPPDRAIRARLEAEAEKKGTEALHARLATVDPEAAARIDFRNLRRVIRALEVYEKTGVPISTHQKRKPPPYRILQVGLTMPREALYLRIDDRINAMFQKNLRQEVKVLREQGYSWQLPAMSGLGYRQFEPYFQGQISLDEVAASIKKETRRFIRQQYTWFRLDDETIWWVDVSEAGFEAVVLEKVKGFLSR